MVTNGLFWILLLLGPLAYWATPARVRMWTLAAISAAYVASVSGWGLAVLAVLMLLTWSVRIPGGPRLGLPLRAVLLGLLGYLAWFKYVPELAESLAPQSSLASIALPLGISFFTFKLIHVAVEISRGNLRDRSPASFIGYVLLFPIFTAGPIEQYDHFLRNIEPRPVLKTYVEGVWRIIIGLIKKFVIAEILVFDRLMDECTSSQFLGTLDAVSTGLAWRYLALVFLYGYFDFSAYSDIAIGAARLFGIRVTENFNNPLVANNLSDFWKRWHMSLAAWTQRYVYMPVLGLTRNPYVGVYATFMAMGLWHSGTVSYLGWGLYHATGVTAALATARFRRGRGGRLPVIDRVPRWGTVLTWLFLTGSSIFVVTNGAGGWAIVRVVGKLIGIDVGGDSPAG